MGKSKQHNRKQSKALPKRNTEPSVEQQLQRLIEALYVLKRISPDTHVKSACKRYQKELTSNLNPKHRSPHIVHMIDEVTGFISDVTSLHQTDVFKIKKPKSKKDKEQLRNLSASHVDETPVVPVNATSKSAPKSPKPKSRKLKTEAQYLKDVRKQEAIQRERAERRIELEAEESIPYDDLYDDLEPELGEWTLAQNDKGRTKNSTGALHYEMYFSVAEAGSPYRCLQNVLATIEALSNEMCLDIYKYFINFHYRNMLDYINYPLNPKVSLRERDNETLIIQIMKNSLENYNVCKEREESFYDLNNIRNGLDGHHYDETRQMVLGLDNLLGITIIRYDSDDSKTFDGALLEGIDFPIDPKVHNFNYKVKEGNNPAFFKYNFVPPNLASLLKNDTTSTSYVLDMLTELQIYTSSNEAIKCANYQTPCFVWTIAQSLRLQDVNVKEVNTISESIMSKLSLRHLNIADSHQILKDLGIQLKVSKITLSDSKSTFKEACEVLKHRNGNKVEHYFGASASETKYYVESFLYENHIFPNIEFDKDYTNKFGELINVKFKHCGISKFTSGYVVFKLAQANMFKPITLSDMSILKSVNYDMVEQNVTELVINNSTCKSFSEIYESKKQKQAKNKQNTDDKEDDVTVDVLWFADFETFTNKDTTHLHEAFLIACTSAHKNSLTNKWGLSDSIITFEGSECAFKFLTYVVNSSRKCERPIVYFHNLSYDINFLAYLGIRTSINNQTDFFQATIVFKGKEIHFRDSYKMITYKLAMFPDMFALTSGEKEIFPYDLYNAERLKANMWKIEEADKFERQSWTSTQKADFKDNVMKIPNCFIQVNGQSYFNMMEYAKFYCKQDVRILSEGLLKFNEMAVSDGLPEPINSLTISSLANEVLKQRVYSKIGDDLYFLGGSLLLYLKQAINGGRTMCAFNKAWLTNESPEQRIVDYDAVSMYSSAMDRLKVQGGKPEPIVITRKQSHRIYNRMPSWLKSYNSFIVEIDIVKVNKHYAFPLILKRKSSIQYNTQREDAESETNIITGNFYNDTDIDEAHPHHTMISKSMLQDLIKYHQIEFRVRSNQLARNLVTKSETVGLGWRGKRYDILAPVIKDLYAKRSHYKSIGNPLEQVYKLILNSIYGKMIESEHPVTYVYKKDIDKTVYRSALTNQILPNDPAERQELLRKNEQVITYKTNEFLGYIVKNSYKVESWTTIRNHKHEETPIRCIKVRTPIHKCFRNILLGIQVLDMSKRIINEVSCTAHDNRIPMYYTDTDSIHLHLADLPKLEAAYEERYGRVLNGTNLGQFHSDFPKFGVKQSKDNPYVVQSISSRFVMKKFYIDILENHVGERYPFVRCKGISEASILNYVHQNYNKHNVSKEDFLTCLNKQSVSSNLADSIKVSSQICEGYLQLYDDIIHKRTSPTYNLCDAGLKITKSMSLQIATRTSFKRTVKAKYQLTDIANFFEQ